MNTWMYIQIDILPLLALLAILKNSFSHFQSTQSIIRFRILISLIIAILTVDGINWYLLARPFAHPLEWISVINITYFLLTEGIAYFWFLYVYDRINGNVLSTKQKWYLRLSLIPLLIVCVIIVLSPWNKWIFYINPADGSYHRGSLHLLQVACGFGFMLFASLLAYRKSRQQQLIEQKKEYLFLARMAILPFIGGTLQTINMQMILLWPFTAAACFLIYINYQSHQISMDTLTALNNRGSLERYLHGKMQTLESGWYFVMLDVNHFKAINDKYGHIEGDRALRVIADTLKSVLGTTKAFLSRYGGDEFAIVGDFASDDELDAAIEAIRQEIDRRTQSGNISYRIEISVGYARFENKKETPVRDLIELADKRMYQQKRS